MDEYTVIWEEQLGSNFCRTTVSTAGIVQLQMRTPRGNWTRVQFMNQHGINRSSNFRTPPYAIEKFLEACMAQVKGVS